MPTCYRHPDRETGLSCSECGRPICTDCVTYAPVGLRCPDHAGKATGTTKVRRTVNVRGDDLVTRLLIGANVLIFLGEIATGASLMGAGGSTLAARWLLWGPFVQHGDWWRIFTAGFLHDGIFHIAVNMYSLWLLGASLERIMGRGRYILIYLVSLIAGSAGVLILSWDKPTLGASGAIFGLLGAALVLERQRVINAPGLMGILVLNLVISFAGSSFISVGGHLGGLVGGVLMALVLSRFGRGHALYGRFGPLEIAGTLVLIVGSFLLAEWAAHAALHSVF